jgi:hypothetical protein
MDGDGDLDIVITQVGRRPLLLRTDQDLGHPRLRVRLQGRDANRGAIGAGIELSANGETQHRQVMPTRSCLSQVELPVTFGLSLGQDPELGSLKITWPDPTVQVIPAPGTDTELVVEQVSSKPRP